MCKTRDVKGWDEKVTGRRGRAFIQKIITPFSSISPSGNPALLLNCSPIIKQKLGQACAWLTDILTDVSGHRVK